MGSRQSESVTHASTLDALGRLAQAREHIEAGEYMKAAVLAKEASEVLVALDERLLREWKEAVGWTDR